MKATKITSRKTMLLGSALLGICTTVAIANPAQAAPRDADSTQNRHHDQDDHHDWDDQDDNAVTRDDRDGKRDAHQGPRGNRADENHAGNRGQRRGQRDENQEGRTNHDANANDDHQHGRGDYQSQRGNQGRSNNGNDYGRQNKGYDYQDRTGNSPQNNNRFPTGNRGQINGGYQTNGGHTYTGTVTRVRSNTSFDVNINGNTFNVYLDAPAPRGLSKGDSVQVRGVQQDKNDIRNASVSLLRNR